jgi:glycolate oxidase
MGNQSIYFLGRGPSTQDALFSYQQLRQDFAHQGEFLSSQETREWLACYDQDSQHLHSRLPLLVFQPSSVLVIAPFIQACYEYKIPVIARCGGTGLMGCAIACQGGIVILTGHLRAILKYDSEKGVLTAEPGVTPSQLFQLCASEGWSFPISMATEGVAGLAGCLSTGAKGYHQARPLISHFIRSVTLIDGTGKEHILPSSFLYGAEGLFGIITQLDIQLSKIQQKRVVFQVYMSWEEFLAKLDQLKAHSTLISILWQEKDQFTLVLEGDEWRVKGAFHHLEKIINPIFKLPNEWRFNFDYPPRRHELIILSHALPLFQIPFLLPLLHSLCQQIGFQYQIWSNVLEGSLHMLLFSAEEFHVFSKQLEKFLGSWINILENHQGFLISRHGVGALLRHYMPPFFSEEEICFLQRLRNQFDPEHLFLRDHFFPVHGKSMERIRFS